MSDNQFRDFLRKQVLFEIKTKKMRQTLTEEQIGHIAHALILESDTLNEGLFSAIGSLLGGGVKKVKQFLSRRAVSYLGVSKRSPLYEPLTSFISSMPTKDIYFLYRGDTRHRERLVDILTDETVNILKRDMPDVLGLDTAGSLGGPVVDSVTRVVNTPGFKASIKRSFNDSFVRFANSEVADMSSIRQAISDLRGEVGGLSGDIQNLKTQFSARPSATTGAKMKDRKPTDPLDSDTYNDGLPDGEETELGTDPGKADTDGDGLPDGEEVTGQAAPGDEAEEAAEEAAEAAVEAEEAEAVGDEVAAEEAAEDAKEAAEKAEDAVEGASDVEAAEAAAEEARKKARKAEASKLRIPMRDFIKAKLNLDNDLGRYDPRISLEDLQAIHDNFLAA